MGKKEKRSKKYKKNMKLTTSAFLTTMRVGTLIFLCFLFVSCSDSTALGQETGDVQINFQQIEQQLQEHTKQTSQAEQSEEFSIENIEKQDSYKEEESAEQDALYTLEQSSVRQDSTNRDNSLGYLVFQGVKYRIIPVDGGDTNGERQANVAVDVGYGDRIYWGLTNEYAQLVYVIADEIILQDDSMEPVNANGRYYEEEAFVDGTEMKQYDQGHVIADSLGGVANAYNITPQSSELNRSGDQAYMEKSIHYGGGCKSFVAEILYLDTTTQIPSQYMITYQLRGNTIYENFMNEDPVIEDQTIIVNTEGVEELETPVIAPQDVQTQVTAIDSNGDGQVTIKEARAAGFQMPIYSNHWLYQYMHDGDGDGKVGE